MELLDADKPKLLTNVEVHKLIKEKLESKKKVDAIAPFVESLKKFQLSKSEILMLINHCPSTQVELSNLINDMDSRLTSDQIDEVLELVNQYFPEGVTASQNINSTGTLEDTSSTS